MRVPCPRRFALRSIAALQWEPGGLRTRSTFSAMPRDASFSSCRNSPRGRQKKSVTGLASPSFSHPASRRGSTSIGATRSKRRAPLKSSSAKCPRCNNGSNPARRRARSTHLAGRCRGAARPQEQREALPWLQGTYCARPRLPRDHCLLRDSGKQTRGRRRSPDQRRHQASTAAFEFDPEACGDCRLRFQCTQAASGRGRTVSIATDESRQRKFRALQRSPSRRAQLRQRTAVEHSLAHIAARKGDQARYRGTRKNLFDLRRAATIQNLEGLHRLMREAA